MLVKVYFKQGSWVIRDHSGELDFQVLGYAREILLKHPSAYPTHFVGFIQKVNEFYKVRTAPDHPFLDNLRDQFSEISEGKRKGQLDDRFGIWYDSETGEHSDKLAFVHLKGNEITFDTQEDIKERASFFKRGQELLQKTFFGERMQVN